MELNYHEHDPRSAPEMIERNSAANPPQVFYELPDKNHNPNIAFKTHHELQTATTNTRSRKTTLLWIAVTGTLIIILAATIGGVLGSRRNSEKNPTNTHSAGGEAGSSVSTSGSASRPTAFNVPGNSDGVPGQSTVNDAWAFNGTSLASFTFPTTEDTASTNYYVFFQHSNGELRKVVYNNSRWQVSEFITNDALLGTPIAAYWRGVDQGVHLIHLFYLDKNSVLQELRGKHASNSWVNGTLGQLSATSSASLGLTAQFAGACQGVGTAWLTYHIGSGNEARALFHNMDLDTWSVRDIFSDVKAGAAFLAYYDIGVWRFFYVSSENSQLQERICVDCCMNATSAGWRTGLSGTTISSTEAGFGGYNVGGPPRMLYYLDSNNTIRELNNTGVYPNEVWIENASSTKTLGNTGQAANPNDPAKPTGLAVATGIPNGKMAMSTGFRGITQQIWLFYQASSTDITVIVRDRDEAGYWADPATIPITTVV
ncbi:hypothetical protein GJ744_012271 [Endocarpon pusillum]|uniref:Fucose-specific lectin n=1 Tax=Endocarpon pusillum TaxID=364733 RepID=A0A8H7AJ78_9EURO|nr:hypothetical protein GJ744_012271 [Endocarpon pusillum]